MWYAGRLIGDKQENPWRRDQHRIDRGRVWLFMYLATRTVTTMTSSKSISWGWKWHQRLSVNCDLCVIWNFGSDDFQWWSLISQHNPSHIQRQRFGHHITNPYHMHSYLKRTRYFRNTKRGVSDPFIFFFCASRCIIGRHENKFTNMPVLKMDENDPGFMSWIIRLRSCITRSGEIK